MIIDYSVLRPPIPLLKAAGVTAVGRYIGWDCEPGYACIRKNLTPAERDQLLAAGIAIFLNFEYAADAARHGAPKGTEDARLATRQIAALGFTSPANPMAAYYALDYDVPDFAPQLPNLPQNARAKLGPNADYFDAIHATKPNHEPAGYGGYWAVSRLLDAGLVHKTFQTLAWSGCRADTVPPPNAVKIQDAAGDWFLFDTRAVLRQELRQIFGAADVDSLTTAAHDFGQWPRPVIPAPPPVLHWADGTQSLEQLAAGRNTTRAHLWDESVRLYAGMLAAAPLAKGTPWGSSRP